MYYMRVRLNRDVDAYHKGDIFTAPQDSKYYSALIAHGYADMVHVWEVKEHDGTVSGKSRKHVRSTSGASDTTGDEHKSTGRSRRKTTRTVQPVTEQEAGPASEG